MLNVFYSKELTILSLHNIHSFVIYLVLFEGLHCFLFTTDIIGNWYKNKNTMAIIMLILLQKESTAIESHYVTYISKDLTY